MVESPNQVVTEVILAWPLLQSNQELCKKTTLFCQTTTHDFHNNWVSFTCWYYYSQNVKFFNSLEFIQYVTEPTHSRGHTMVCCHGSAWPPVWSLASADVRRKWGNTTVAFDLWTTKVPPKSETSPKVKLLFFDPSRTFPENSIKIIGFTQTLVIYPSDNGEAESAQQQRTVAQ